MLTKSGEALANRTRNLLKKLDRLEAFNIGIVDLNKQEGLSDAAYEKAKRKLMRTLNIRLPKF